MTTRDPLDRAIVIIGAPRSGTSVLARILEKHATLAYAAEPRLIWRYGNDSKSDMLRPDDATPRVEKYIRDRFRKVVTDAGKQRLLEKTPSNALRMGFVNQVLPGCQFVHIMRNGYDSVISIRDYWQRHTHGLHFSKIGTKESVLKTRLKEIKLRQIPYYGKEFLARILPRIGGSRRRVLWGPRLPGMAQMASEFELLEMCALQWRTCVEMACQYGRSLSPDCYREFQLESLDGSQVGEMLEFLGLEPDEKVSEYFEGDFQSGKSGARKRDADPKELETIRHWVEPTMQWLGYDV